MDTDLIASPPEQTNVLKTMIGLKVEQAERYSETQSTCFQFSGAYLGIFGEMTIQPPEAQLLDFIGDTITAYDDDDPACVEIRFNSGKILYFNILGSKDDPAPERIIYSNLNTSPPLPIVVAQVSDFNVPDER